MKKFALVSAVLLGLAVMASQAKACNYTTQTRFVAGFTGFHFNPAVTFASNGFAFNAFTPATIVTNIPTTRVFVQRNVGATRSKVKVRGGRTKIKIRSR